MMVKIAGICTNSNCNAVFYGSENDAPKFCPECGTKAIAACPNCGKKISAFLTMPYAKFCEEPEIRLTYSKLRVFTLQVYG
jgi:hypothetical protein